MHMACCIALVVVLQIMYYDGLKACSSHMWVGYMSEFRVSHSMIIDKTPFF